MNLIDEMKKEKKKVHFKLEHDSKVVHLLFSFKQTFTAKVDCDDAQHMLDNLDYLSSLISKMEVVTSWINPDVIENLSNSINGQPDPLIEPMQKLISTAMSYREATERALDKITEKLQEMNDLTNSDMDTANLVESRLNQFKNDEIRVKGCARIDEAEVQLKKFTSEIDDYLKSLKTEVAPQCEQFVASLTDMRTKWNTNTNENIDFGAATKEIDELKAQLESETAATDGRIEKTIDALGSFTNAKGVECEKYMKDVLEFFSALA